MQFFLSPYFSLVCICWFAGVFIAHGVVCWAICPTSCLTSWPHAYALKYVFHIVCSFSPIHVVSRRCEWNWQTSLQGSICEGHLLLYLCAYSNLIIFVNCYFDAIKLRFAERLGLLVDDLFSLLWPNEIRTFNWVIIMLKNFVCGW